MAKRRAINENLVEACEAHSTLYVFGSIVSILEGGNIPGYNATAARIIKLCKAEMDRQLARHDRKVAALQSVL